jgi:hypothetical protein
MDCIAPASFTHTRTSLRPSVVEMDCIAPASFTHTRTSPSTTYPDFLRSYRKTSVSHDPVRHEDLVCVGAVQFLLSLSAYFHRQMRQST